MYAVNTVRNHYNDAERAKLADEYFKAEQAWETALEKASDIEDDDAYCTELDRIDHNEGAIKSALWIKCFAAQFHKTRNEWFAGVVEQYADGEWHSISEKQYRCFTKYACDEDCDTWKNGQKYCRCGNKLITVIWKNAHRAIKVQEI